MIIHPEEGTNSSPETSVYYQEWSRVTTQKPLYMSAVLFYNTDVCNNLLSKPVIF
jgi:hypothetical protein